MMVPVSDFQLMGNLKSYVDMNTGSGKPVYRGFCSECGSPIKSDAVSAEGYAFIKAGTLDDLTWAWLKPTIQIYCDSRQPWVTLSDETRNIARDS